MKRDLRHGMSAWERFWLGAKLPDGLMGCWIGRTKSDQYYGHIMVDGHREQAHRWAYEQYIGPIPAGMDIDHLCRVRPCRNPWHVEPVTQRVNILRGEGPCAVNARKTHCQNGHALTGDNLVPRDLPRRRCRTCTRAMGLAAYYRHKKPASTKEKKTTCPSGHPYDEINTRFVNGQRRCRTCCNRRTAEWHQRRREVKAA